VLVIPSDGAERPLKAGDDRLRSVALGEGIMAGVTLARDLVNEPPNTLTPATLAERARQEAEELGLEIIVNDLTAIEAGRMGLLKAVGQGSRNPPHFVHATYHPPLETPRGTVALVGKGITFDSGGLSLKTAKGQTDMKSDMGGAAVVLGALRAAALCKLPYVIHGLIPAAENMPGGSAIHPGDIFTSRNGMTVEVANTDAEGRLILADALSYAVDLKPDVIFDFATLTGACLVALGPYRAGLFGTDERWIDRYTQAAGRAGEAIWRLPLAKELSDGLKSPVADLKNVGGSWGGSITAALFLKEFVGSTAWIHVDIAGPAFLEKAHGFHPKGGTGYGVLTLMELLKD
jgi:leucyl aminopeptidase